MISIISSTRIRNERVNVESSYSRQFFDKKAHMYLCFVRLCVSFLFYTLYLDLSYLAFIVSYRIVSLRISICIFFKFLLMDSFFFVHLYTIVMYLLIYFFRLGS